MAVDRRLIELLVCPACRGAIEYKPRRSLIICTQCDLRYPVRDDIPVMLVEEATRPPTRGRSRG
ncbi:MAG: Trm112 family protein [Actinobacteria bacterium]|nr:Trm112 family protein [Actinomycetota bacterium]